MIINRESDRRLFWRIHRIRRHWLRILEGAGVCALAALAVSLISPKIYRATTYILVSESKIGTPSREGSALQMAMLPTFIPFVDNDALISQALKKFALDGPPYYLTIDKFRRSNSLDVRIPKSTRLLELNVEFPDARLAADLANEFARTAVEFNDQINASDTSATREFLKRQLDESMQTLARVTAESIKVNEDARLEDREKALDILLNEKDDLSVRLQQLRMNLAEDQSRSGSLKAALANEPDTIVLKKAISADRLLELTAEGDKSAGAPMSMTEESPNKAKEDMRRDYVSATVGAAADAANIDLVTGRLAQVNKEIPQLLSQLTALRGQIDSVKNEYALAIEAVKNATHEYQTASVTVTSKTQDMKQMAPALIPERPVRPSVVLNTGIGFILGALLSAVVAMLLDNYREARRDSPFAADELEGMTIHGD